MQINRAELEQLLKDLIQQESVVNTEGERQIAENIYAFLKQLPYFQNNPTHVELTETYLDKKWRYNVVAYVRGKVMENNDTVILMGHLDTVGTDDFGKHQSMATDPDKVKKVLQQKGTPQNVQAHASSQEWMFGRGSLDMKSGVASHLYILKYFSEHISELKGNVMLVITCDEEDSSHGIRSALKDIRRLKEREGFSYIAAVNSDYTSPRYEGDENRYIYVGTVGKLLPTFFVAGKETHVGQVFEGFDPNLMISELTKEIDYNPLLCDEWFGEWTLPPVTLKQTDLKPFYDVQTPLTAFVYYNFFVHSWSPKQVLQKLKVHADKAFRRAIEAYQDRYETYCKLSGDPYEPMQIQPRVYTFEEYYEWMTLTHGAAFEEEIGRRCKELANNSDIDIRQYACRMVEEIWKWDHTKNPVMILFYSNLYIPRIAISRDTPEGDRLMTAIEDAVEQVQPMYNKNIEIKQFFPYISDMSYVALSDDEESIMTLEKNLPTWGEAFRLNVEDIRALNVPVCNIGPYGFDAHKKHERVELTYSLETVPLLTYSVIRHLFAGS
ncbi:M20/M25/M40 family metallo-hydrolase [Caldalkalibacillus salinus]|uniref:M20/M25/M40 family metallo-hydrolase n=1 Tax=Caldalkalibacillus salinus TaxID=2803787 RepID=UPI001920BEAC|nr:M20/M25/M40 family metallo-hydrolase [Caldalkalibacillus salinus]